MFALLWWRGINTSPCELSCTAVVFKDHRTDVTSSHFTGSSAPKRKPSFHCYYKLMLKLMKIKYKFQYFLATSGKKMLVFKAIEYHCHLFSLLNFPCSASLNFYDVTWLPNIQTLSILIVTLTKETNKHFFFIPFVRVLCASLSSWILIYWNEPIVAYFCTLIFFPRVI